MFEGITGVLPLMDSSESKERFSYILTCGLATLCALNIAFSELCYYAFADNLNEPVII
jgi:hypothetical protein